MRGVASWNDDPADTPLSPAEFWKVANPNRAKPIPEGAMRVAPGSDAVVWKVSPEHSGEL